MRIVCQRHNMHPVYNQIGSGYSKHRRADPRIVKELCRLLSVFPPATVADVGAGTGNYSRALADFGFRLEAVEPSEEMHRQALPHPNVRWHFGTAERLPLADESVDAVICVLAAHHFSSLQSAIAEMGRVCRTGPIVWLTFDPREVEAPWLADYFPEIWNDAFSVFPPLAEIRDDMASATRRQVQVSPFPIPFDLEDCFMAAGWRRPEMYLDPEVRRCMSAFALAEPDIVNDGLQRLGSDLQTGRWRTTYGDLLSQKRVDWGYRFLKAERKE
jgi:ubiquinone/menaquinone biosynthesis C-methylase UbiE